MNVFFTLALNIFILAIIGCIIENLTINEKILSLLKPAISIMIILTVLNFISNINFKEKINFNIDRFPVDTQAVWDSQAKNCEYLFENEILKECNKNDINITSVKVNIACENNTFKIENINISGVDKISAKNYISGKYRIGLAYISTNED